MGIYPFGTPVTARPPSASARRPLLVLGAYPSAVHVAWKPPDGSGLRSVRALPVADEPSPFWDGHDADERVSGWMAAYGISREEHGAFSAPERLNGPSGTWVAERLLAPFGMSRDDVWITDSLDTYRMSTGVAQRLANTYDRGRLRFGWPAAALRGHPSESEIVTEALAGHRERLRDEITTCRPERIVTLGNAALRVVAALAGHHTRKLTSDASYGGSLDITIDGRQLRWTPLAHPAAPKVYQDAHERWRSNVGR